MILYFFGAYLVLLLCCAITGFYSTRRIDKTFLPLRLLPWFLLLTLINEIIALIWAMRYGTNHWIYNIYLIIQVSFYSYLLRWMIESRRMKKLLTGVLLVYPVLATINIGFIQGIGKMNSLNFFTGAIFLAFSSGYALNEMFRKDVAGRPFINPLFWIAGSILVMETAMIPVLLPPYFDLPLTRLEAEIIIFLDSLVNFITYPMFLVAFWRLNKNRVAATL
jgi:hypothetical protein